MVNSPPCLHARPPRFPPRYRRYRRIQEEGRHLQLQFQFRFTRDSEEVLFAFCFPYSYDDCNKDLERCEDQVYLVCVCVLLLEERLDLLLI